MIAATLFSGLGSPECACPEFDWRFCAEIERFPSDVHARRFLGVPNLGDVTAPDFIARMKSYGPVDVLVAGSPCQAFSVAGLRQSMQDARGNLTLEFVRAANELDPGWILWENVPGVLSTQDNAFGCFLGALVGADEAIVPVERWTNAGVVSGPRRTAAWRILDAQYFGVAQRRRRIFVLAVRGSRNWACADALLPIGEGLSRYPPPRGEAGQRVAPTIEARANAGGAGWGTDFMCGGGLAACYGGNNTSDAIDVASGCNAKGGSGRMDFESETFVVRGISDYGDGKDCAGGSEALVTHALRADGFDASGKSTTDPRAGIGIGEPGDPMYTLQSGKQHAVAFSCKDHGADAGEIAPTLRSMGHDGSHPNGGGQVAVAFEPRFVRNGRGAPDDITSPLKAESGRTGKGDGATCVATGMAVRRLTVVECCRLQGFPDTWCHVPTHKRRKIDEEEARYLLGHGVRCVPHFWQRKRAGRKTRYTRVLGQWSTLAPADGPTYKAIGNAMAVPVMRWILKRVEVVNQL